MKKLNLERLGEFKQNMSDLNGGRPVIQWAHEEGDVRLHETFSIGTYVDGFNMGTDGYED